MTVGRVRPSVSALAAYRPGKGAKQAEAEHGIVGAIKLASNENPYAPVPAVVAALIEASAGVNRYADHRSLELRAKLANWLGVDSAQIAVGCGSVGLIQQLCLAYVDPGDEVVYPWISFEAYPVNVKMMGGIAVCPPLVDYAFDMEAITAAMTDKTKLVFLATPNNPTGTAISTKQTAALLDAISDDVLVVIDEAYREFCDPTYGDPVVDLVPHYPNVVVTRTFSKAYGLAGLRVGYAVAHPEVVAEIDKILLAFAVNAIAQAGAMAALDSLDEIQVNVDAILKERTRVVAALSDNGWKLPDAQANFVWIPVGETTTAISLELEKRGVVVRPFAGAGIRVTIGTVEQNDRFLTNFAEIANA